MAPLLGGAMLLCASPVAAQEAPPVPSQPGPVPPPVDTDSSSFSIGAGVGVVPSYEGSDDYRIIPAGIVRGKVAGHNFFSRGLQFYFDLVPEGPGEKLDISVGPVAGLRVNRTSSIKDVQVGALGKLNTAYEVGGFVGISKIGIITSEYDNLAFRLSYLTDVGNAHESHVITPAIEYGTPLSRYTFVGLGVSADFVGDAYASYYFDVSPAGAAVSGLRPFQADGGFKSWSISLAGSQAITGDLLGGLSLFAVGSYTRLQKDFRDSPIVSQAGSPNQWFGAIGLAYSF